MYREKASKAAKRKSVSIVEPNNEKALVPRAPYVEDASDAETPPHVPTPPPAVPAQKRDSVFDYMVDEGVIDPEDRDLFWFAETAQEIWDGILRWYDQRGEPLPFTR